MEKEEKVEEKKEEVKIEKKNGKHIILVTVLMTVLMIVCFAMGFAVGGTNIVNKYLKLENDTSEKKEKKDTIDKTEEKEEMIEFSEETKKKIHHFIEVGSYAGNSSLYVSKKFNDGVSTLTRKDKLMMTYVGAIKINNKLNKLEKRRCS